MLFGTVLILIKLWLASQKDEIRILKGYSTGLSHWL